MPAVVNKLIRLGKYSVKPITSQAKLTQYLISALQMQK